MGRITMAGFLSFKTGTCAVPGKASGGHRQALQRRQKIPTSNETGGFRFMMPDDGPDSYVSTLSTAQRKGIIDPVADSQTTSSISFVA
ncbi:hypothetical protein GCM10011403_14210 [Pseudohongiella nitratireducens]|jgi:hypothetical protein|uniref:Uncharacterized protein n=1 Tax=Pseudohongiella nitratireducens TaxID=1768907 RepID=A0A917LUX0_9GAMM|nr:hypothetical protein GCM10011403_14210 [Pseudohongiella nitratireducens]